MMNCYRYQNPNIIEYKYDLHEKEDGKDYLKKNLICPLCNNIDMYFSHNCRMNNIFMYVDNNEKYGFIYDGIKDIVPQNAINSSLYFFETDPKPHHSLLPLLLEFLQDPIVYGIKVFLKEILPNVFNYMNM